jgi:mRNA interferase HicA
MTCNELKRWLKKQGCTFERGKGSHQIVWLGKRRSVFAGHGKNEVPTGTLNAIKRDLGLGGTHD